jgi:molecular chaperone IbpA
MTYTEIADKYFHEFGGYFDYMLSSSKDDKYPPYNLIRHNDRFYAIQLAVAGFGRDEIEVTLKGKTLTISGEKLRPLSQEGGDFLHRGIATRKFKREFRATSDVKVTDAHMVENGVLTVCLERVIPESEQAHKIEIRENREFE